MGVSGMYGFAFKIPESADKKRVVVCTDKHSGLGMLRYLRYGRAERSLVPAELRCNLKRSSRVVPPAETVRS